MAKQREVTSLVGPSGSGKTAACEESVAKLPDGYNKYDWRKRLRAVGDEKQRISITHAFLKNSPIILLDEATANLRCEKRNIDKG